MLDYTLLKTNNEILSQGLVDALKETVRLEEELKNLKELLDAVNQENKELNHKLGVLALGFNRSTQIM